MNASRTVIRLTIAGMTSEIDPSDAEAVRAAMGQLFAAKAAGDVTATMIRVEGAPPAPPAPPAAPAAESPIVDSADDSADDDGDDPTVQIPAAKNPNRGGFARSSAGSVQIKIDETAADRVAMNGAAWNTTGPIVGPVIVGPDGDRSAIAIERIARHDEAARAAGFALPPPVLAAGTRCNLVGDGRLHALRMAVEDLPSFGDAATAVRRAIADEDRRDVIVHANAINMTRDGALHAGVTPIGTFEIDAFRAFTHRLGNGIGAGYLSALPAARRADNINADIRASLALASETDRDPVGFMLRTRRTADGGRAIFATLSPSYGILDADAILDVAAPLLADTRAEVMYDGRRLSAVGLWMPNQVVDFAAGDIFKAGVRISTSDDGGGSIRVSAVLWRNQCRNLIIVGDASVDTLKRVHKGEAGDIARDVAQGINAARDLIAPFLEDWGKARRASIGDSADDVNAHIRRIVAEGRGAVKLSKADQAAAVDAIHHAWTVEPGFTVADLANALTRAAWESADLQDDYRRHLERRAGQLVTVGR